MMQPLTIRLEIEGVRYHMLHALSAHHAEIEGQVADTLARVIEEFDFEREVAEIAPDLIRAETREATRKAIHYTFETPSVRDYFRRIAHDAVHEYLQEHGRDDV